MARSSTRERRRRREPHPEEAADEPDDRGHDLRPGGLRRLRGDLEGPHDAAHAADVPDERDPRHRHAGRAARHRICRRSAGEGDRGDRNRLRHDQHRRRLPRHRPHARDVPWPRPQAEGRRGGGDREALGVGPVSIAPPLALSQSSDFVTACYIVAFSLFIFGISQGTRPTTARRGNLIAAGGMAIAVVITLSLDVISNGVLIVLGILIGSLVGGVASRRVQMTQMPQMVALYNGVGGGAAALIAWSEFRHRLAIGGDIPLDVMIPVLFSLVVGSVSFWGSIIAFAKLQELISGRPIRFPGQHIFNGILLAGILAGCIVLAAGHASGPSQALFIAVLIAAAVLGNLFVLPIGGADMPVVISLLNAFTGLAAAAAGFALDNVALIVAGTLVGSSGTILTLAMATAMNRSVPNIL